MASDNTPRLPVATVRKIFSDTSTMAEPTDARAATCFFELGLDPEIAASRGEKIAGFLNRLYDEALQSSAVQRHAAPPAGVRTCELAVRPGYSGGGGTSGKRRGSPCGPRTSTSSRSNDGAMTSLGTPSSTEPKAPSAVPAISASWLCS